MKDGTMLRDLRRCQGLLAYSPTGDALDDACSRILKCIDELRRRESDRRKAKVTYKNHGSKF